MLQQPSQSPDLRLTEALWQDLKGAVLKLMPDDGSHTENDYFKLQLWKMVLQILTPGSETKVCFFFFIVLIYKTLEVTKRLLSEFCVLL